MDKKETAIKLWMDESLNINGDYILIGYLITDCYEKEYSFFKSLTEKRNEIKCFDTLHGNKINSSDLKKIDLFDNWLSVFKNKDFENGIYFHMFLYKRDDTKISKDKTFEHYFAKQSIFSLALKMKGSKLFDKHINNMFKEVKTLFILVDDRGDTKLNKKFYKEEIIKQIENQTKKDTKTNDMTIRFSFVSDECFDGIQFTDMLLNAVRQKLIDNNEHPLAKIFDKHFLDGLKDNVKKLGFKEIYKWDKKFNFFEEK